MGQTPTPAELIAQADDIALAARISPAEALHRLVLDLQEHGDCDEYELESSSTAAWHAINGTRDSGSDRGANNP